jgi:hypothetical protein
MDEKIIELLPSVHAVVVFTSRKMRDNIRCRKVAEYFTNQKSRNYKDMAEIIYADLQGDFTMYSYPHAVGGWLRHLVKGRKGLYRIILI